MSVTGKFEMISSDNFGNYLKEVGVGFIKRQLAEKTTPVVEIIEKDGNYTLKTNTALKNTVIEFKLGQEFDENTADDRVAKSTVTKDGNKLIHVQKIGDSTSTIVREIEPDKMTAVFSANGVESKRVYKRLE